MIDWFKKAKEAKEKKVKEKEKPRYGFLGHKDKSYKEAQDALAEADGIEDEN